MNYHWSFVEFIINSILFLALLVIVVAAFAFFVGIRDKLEATRLMRELDKERKKQSEENHSKMPGRRSRGYSSDDFTG